MHTFYFPRSDVREALRDYEKSRDRFIAAKPSIAQSELTFQNAFERLVCVLNDEAISKPIEKHLEIVDGIGGNIVPPENFVSFERQVVNSLTGLSGNKADAIILTGLDGFKSGSRISSPEALVQIITKSHYTIIEKTNSARSLKKKEKKKRKKAIKAASATIITGVTAIVGNIFVFAGSLFYVPSIGAGSGAVVKGSIDMYAVV